MTEAERINSNIESMQAQGATEAEIEEYVATEQAATPDAFNAPQAAPEGAPEPYSFSPMNMVKNVPSSTVKLGADMVGAVVNYEDTAIGLKRLVWGGIQKLIPGDHPDEATVDAVADFYAQRYGSVEAALRTLETDPAGLLSDLSMTLGIAGKVGRVGSISRVANAIDPTNMIINSTVAGAERWLPDAGELYNQAAKITVNKTRSQRDVTRQINTALDEGITLNQSGAAKMTGRIDAINTQIDNAIDAATEAGGTIDRGRLFRHLHELRQRVGGVKMSAPNDLAIIDRVVGDFNRYLDDIGADKLDARTLQELKKSTYKDIDFDYSQQKSVRAVDETRKAVARAAKEDVERLVPDSPIADLNRREGRLIELQDTLEPVIGRVTRRDAVGISLPIKTMAGGQVGGNFGKAVGFMSGLFDAPQIKSRIAIGLHHARQQGLMDLYETGRLYTPYRQGLMEAGQLQEAEKERQWEEEYPSVFNQ